jgi:VanZ family protein
MKLRILYISAFCLYIAALLYLCLAKPDDLPQPEIYFFGLPIDKVVHFCMFLPFPVLMHLVFCEKAIGVFRELLVLVASIAIGIGMACGTEYLQSLTQYRSADILDFYADLKGLSVGCLVVLLHIIFRKRN